MVARRAPAAAVAARNQSTSMVGPTFWAVVAARIKNNDVRGLGAARGGRMDLHGWSWYSKSKLQRKPQDDLGKTQERL